MEEKAVANIVEVIAKKNQRLLQSKDSVLEPIVRVKVSNLIKSLNDGKLITGKDIEHATT